MTEVAGAAAEGAAAAGAGGAAAAPEIWHGGKIDDVTIGFWQNKGIDPKDPVAVATKLTEFYRNSERFVGAPPEEMIRIPKANAPEADIKAYWGRIGVPQEAKDYDLSTVKRSDGKDLDTGFADAFRAAAHSARVTKDQAAPLMAALVKQMEAVDATRAAEKTAYVQTQKEALERNWGTNKPYNEAVAKRALEELGKSAGMTPEQAGKAWDALSTVGGVDASLAMEMLRVVAMGGGRSTEAPFIGADGRGGNPDVMSVAQAIDKIESLKSDRGFYEKLQRGDAAAKREWNDLHKIAGAEIMRRRSGHAA